MPFVHSYIVTYVIYFLNFFDRTQNFTRAQFCRVLVPCSLQMNVVSLCQIENALLHVKPFSFPTNSLGFNIIITDLKNAENCISVIVLMSSVATFSDAQLVVPWKQIEWKCRFPAANCRWRWRCGSVRWSSGIPEGTGANQDWDSRVPANRTAAWASEESEWKILVFRRWPLYWWWLLLIK